VADDRDLTAFAATKLACEEIGWQYAVCGEMENQDQTKDQPAPRGALSYPRCSREGFGGCSRV